MFKALWWAFVDGLIDNDEKLASSEKSTHCSRPECKNHALFKTKVAKIDALFLTKTAKRNQYPLGPHLLISSI